MAQMEISLETLFDGDMEEWKSDFKWSIKETSAFFILFNETNFPARTFHADGNLGVEEGIQVECFISKE